MGHTCEKSLIMVKNYFNKKHNYLSSVTLQILLKLFVWGLSAPRHSKWVTNVDGIVVSIFLVIFLFQNNYKNYILILKYNYKNRKIKTKTKKLQNITTKIIFWF